MASTAPVEEESMFRDIGEIVEARAATTVGPAAGSAAPSGDAAVAPSAAEAGSSSGGGAGAGAGGAAEDDGMLHDYGTDEEEDGADMEQGEPEAFVMNQVMGIESYCVSCEENGKTNVLMTKIPFFREVIVMAFSCQHCGFRSSEVQSAATQAKGCRFEVKITTPQDLNRQLIKSDKASVGVPELQFEIPPGTQAGVLTTVEGMLKSAIEGLEKEQEYRKIVAPEVHDQVAAFLAKLQLLADGTGLPFTLTLDDPSGNSFIENFLAPREDPNMTCTHYHRTPEQDRALGLFAGNAMAEGGAAGLVERDDEDEESGDDAAGAARVGAGAGGPSGVEEHKGEEGDLASAPGHGLVDTVEGDSGTNWKSQKAGGTIKGLTDRALAGPKFGGGGELESIVFDSSSSDAAKEVMTFPVNCNDCAAPGETRMCVTDIPHFKEIIIMSFLCDECGNRTVEVKGGGAVPDHGTKTTLRLEPGPDMEQDLKRDVIKSDTASVEIPELELELSHGSLGGVYTTVEGLMNMIKDKLLETNPFAVAAGDGADPARSILFKEFMRKLDLIIGGEMAFTLHIEDPLANSFVYSPYAPEPDPRLEHLRYTRSYDEDRNLGLLDMRTEGYNPEVEAELEREEAERLASLAAAHAHDRPHPHPHAHAPDRAADGEAAAAPADASPSV